MVLQEIAAKEELFAKRRHFSITRIYLRNERDVYSCVWFDEFDKYLSSNVPQELCNEITHIISYTSPLHVHQSHVHQLTFYVLSNKGVVHYVTVICFQDFLKFSDVIVLVGAERGNSRCYFTVTHRIFTAHTKALIPIAVSHILKYYSII